MQLQDLRLLTKSCSFILKKKKKKPQETLQLGSKKLQCNN